MTLQKRSKAGLNGSPRKVQGWDGTILKDFPTLCEFLTLTVWPDGSHRQPGTFQIFTEQGVWKARLQDKDAKEYAFLSGESIETLLLSVEEALTQDKVEWRPDKPFTRK